MPIGKQNIPNNTAALPQMNPEDLIGQSGVQNVYSDGSADINIDEQQDSPDLNNLGIDVEGMIEEAKEAQEEEFYSNLVDELSQEAQDKLARDVVESFDADKASRKEWEEVLEVGFKNLGLKPEGVTYPFKGACGAFHPLILEAAVKYQSKASLEILPASGPVKCQVLGQVSVEKQQRANRVENHMNWQTTTQMTEYYPDSERLFLYAALCGSGFKKVYHNPTLKRSSSEFVSPDQLVVPNSVPDLERAHRYTHILYKSEAGYNRDVAEGFYSDKDLGEPSKRELTFLQVKQNEILGMTDSSNPFDFAYTFLEQHVMAYIPELDKDKGKIAKPYVVTVDKTSMQVVGVRRNWEFGDKTFGKREYFVHYPFIPGFGFYGFGLIHLLGNYQMTLTAITRSLVDAGQLANVRGGFKLKGIRTEKQMDEAWSMGEWRDMETGGTALKDALFPFEYKEPSPVLLNMLQYLEGRGQQFADSTEQVVSDATNYGPVGTTMALLDASTKFFNSFL